MDFSFLADNRFYLILLHLFGFALGLGGATIADLLFFRFLKDLKISKQEVSILHFVSNIVWVGLFLLYVSGLGIYLSDIAKYSVSDKFLVKCVVVFVVTINGFFLHFFIKPKLQIIDWKINGDYNNRRLRKMAFASGAVSICSWYTAFVLGAMSKSPISFGKLLLLYFGILFVFILGSQLVEIFWSKGLSSIVKSQK